MIDMCPDYEDDVDLMLQIRWFVEEYVPDHCMGR